jgi:hypothetical protein
MIALLQSPLDGNDGGTFWAEKLKTHAASSARTTLFSLASDGTLVGLLRGYNTSVGPGSVSLVFPLFPCFASSFL